jgi:glutamine amidotransferase
MNVTIFDYGAGNLHSLAKALDDGGSTVRIEADPLAALRADLLVLPGVGAFAHAAARIGDARDEMRARIANGLPTIGICLGMQLLLDGSDEGGGPGLGVIEGRVERLRARRLPQIGWNTVDGSDPALVEAELTTAYYANSFVCRPRDPSCVTAWTRYDEDRFPAVVRIHATIGIQFHPEKSSAAGVHFLRDCIRELTR